MHTHDEIGASHAEHAGHIAGSIGLASASCGYSRAEILARYWSHIFSSMTLSSLNHAMNITVGVLALQGAFYEHIQLLKQATRPMTSTEPISWTFTEVRNGEQLAVCDALIIPGGESTTISLVAERSGLLGGLREFVKYEITDAVSMWELQC
jgi:hypothetical protein